MKQVVVVEIKSTNNMDISKIFCFEDNSKGKNQAEQAFKDLILKNTDNPITEDNIKEHIKDGYFVEGPYYLALQTSKEIV